MLLLAQLPDPASAQSLGWIALALFALIGGVNQVLRLTDRFKESPPSHTQYASKTDHNELKARVDKISDDIRAGFDRLDHKRSQSVAGLHDDLKDAIEDLRKEVKSDMGGVHDRISELVAAVGKLQGRMDT